MIVDILLATIVGLALLGLVYYIFIREGAGIYRKAQELAQKGNYTDARILLRSRLDRNPKDPRAHYFMSSLFAKEGNLEEELAHLLEIQKLALYPKEIGQEALLERIGDIYYKRSQLQKAFEYFLELHRLFPDNESALLHLAFLAIGQAEFLVADRYLSRLIEAVPNVSEYHIAAGVCRSILKMPKALSELELAYRQSPQNITAAFLTALQNYFEENYDRAEEILRDLEPSVTDRYIRHVINRLAVAVSYFRGDHQEALRRNEACLEAALAEQWEKEIYDTRLGMAYLAILADDLDKAREHLLELEIQNPADDLIVNISEYRLHLEAKRDSGDPIDSLPEDSLQENSRQNFDFPFHLQNWIKGRISKDAIYTLSGLEQRPKFNLAQFFKQKKRDKEPRWIDKISQNQPVSPLAEREEESISADELDKIIANFNSLSAEQFEERCQKLIKLLKFKTTHILRRNQEGIDLLANSLEKRQIKALFRIRRWSEQPISDIFLREQQSYMNEVKASISFVIAGAKLTPGAQKLLPRLANITIVNEERLARLLKKVL